MLSIIASETTFKVFASQTYDSFQYLVGKAHIPPIWYVLCSYNTHDRALFMTVQRTGTLNLFVRIGVIARDQSEWAQSFHLLHWKPFSLNISNVAWLCFVALLVELWSCLCSPHSYNMALLIILPTSYPRYPWISRKHQNERERAKRAENFSRFYIVGY